MNRSWIEIDLKAIKYNLTQIKKKIGRDKILACIKADAYAHGAISVAQTIEKKVDFFGVATVTEAKELREAEIIIDNETCTDCKLCVYVCPVETLEYAE